MDEEKKYKLIIIAIPIIAGLLGAIIHPNPVSGFFVFNSWIIIAYFVSYFIVAFPGKHKLVNNFDSIDSKDDIDFIAVKNKLIEEITLPFKEIPFNRKALVLGIDKDIIYIGYSTEKIPFFNNFKLYRVECGYMKIEPEMIDWEHLYISEETDIRRKDRTTAIFGMANGFEDFMVSFDFSQLYISLPFENPETGEDEKIDFIVKKEDVNKLKRWFEKNRKYIENQISSEDESSNPPKESSDSPIDILKERLAKGEITEEEFENKKELLDN